MSDQGVPPSDQLFLEVRGWPTLEVDPTPAMRAGQQSVAQCAWCGCVVIQPKPPTAPLGDCPSCRKSPSEPSGGWWLQDLPLAGVREAQG